MMLDGVTGTLFPSRYVADRLAADAGHRPVDPAFVMALRRLRPWWRRVEATCGPATGIRAAFDLVAMPLAAILGFRATSVLFTRHQAHVRLETARAAPVGLLIAGWARRAPAIWRDATALARSFDARWCLVLAPPYLLVVDARSGWSRRSVEFKFPDAIDQPDSAAAFWTVARAAAFDTRDAGSPSIIDALVQAGSTFQDRVREDLQSGVHEALAALMDVLPARGEGRFDEALTLVYRVLFLLFVESRDLVPCRHPVYRHAYAIGALARQAAAERSAAGLWDGLAAITRLLRIGCRVDDLVVRPFNGRLFARASAPTLESGRAGHRDTRKASVRDAAVAQALVALSTRAGHGGRDTITYADLGVEQLGAVYERVLDLEASFAPRASARSVSGAPTGMPPGRKTTPGVVFRPDKQVRSSSRHSAKRKQTGTFYTPRALTEFVVRRTLGPLVAHASSDAILSLRVVDPAMGSGAFLVAACRFLASAYERALVEEGRLADHDIDDTERAQMRRLIAQQCLYGVDRNPVAVQLARLSLWLATLAHGKPLGFLDHRLRAGNSLIGASPDDLRQVTGGRKRPVAPLPLFDEDLLGTSLSRAVGPLDALACRADETVDDVRAKEALWARIGGDASPLHAWKQAADLWCARWFWPDGQPPDAAEMRALIDALVRHDATVGASRVQRRVDVAAALQAAHGFFHWPLECADVFYDANGRSKPCAGFDAVVGNPPWEMLRHDDRAAPDGPRDAASACLVRFIRESGLYPACDRGHVNLYQPFVERALTLSKPGGRVGLVLPWGLATDDGAAALRARLFDHANTDTVVGLDNAGGLFPIHRGLRFLVLVTSPGGHTREMNAHFGIRATAEIERLSDEASECGEDPTAVRLTPAWLATIGGPTRRVPDVRRASDLDLLDTLMRRFPALAGRDGWHASFGRELNVTEDRPSFGSRGLPVIAGKHIQPFRTDICDPPFRIVASEAARLLPDGRYEHARLAYRDVSGVSNRLSLIAAVVPANVVTTHTLYCLRTPLDAEAQHFLCGVLNSWVMNLLARMLMGGHVTTGLVEGLPVPAWRGTARERRIARLARRLATSPSRVASAALQAIVARHLGLDAPTFARVVEAFPLIDQEERTAAVRAFSKEEPR